MKSPYSDTYKRIVAEMALWPTWKREVYNKYFATSAHARKLPITIKGICHMQNLSVSAAYKVGGVDSCRQMDDLRGALIFTFDEEGEQQTHILGKLSTTEVAECMMRTLLSMYMGREQLQNILNDLIDGEIGRDMDMLSFFSREGIEPVQEHENVDDC